MVRMKRLERQTHNAQHWALYAVGICRAHLIPLIDDIRHTYRNLSAPFQNYAALVPAIKYQFCSKIFLCHWHNSACYFKGSVHKYNNDKLTRFACDDRLSCMMGKIWKWSENNFLLGGWNREIGIMQVFEKRVCSVFYETTKQFSSCLLNTTKQSAVEQVSISSFSDKSGANLPFSRQKGHHLPNHLELSLQIFCLDLENVHFFFSLLFFFWKMMD